MKWLDKYDTERTKLRDGLRSLERLLDGYDAVRLWGFVDWSHVSEIGYAATVVENVNRYLTESNTAKGAE